MNGPLQSPPTDTAAGPYPRFSDRSLLVYVDNLPLQATQWATLEEYPIAAHWRQPHLVLTHHFSCGSIVAPRKEVLVVGEIL